MSKPYTVTGLSAVLNKLKDLPKSLEEDIEAELEASANTIANNAKRDAPTNHGFLKNGISARKAGKMNFEVISAANYSAYVEWGTRAQVSVPPELQEFAAQFKGTGAGDAKAAIYEWCRQKGIPQEAWWPIFLSIMIKGTRPHPFFFHNFLAEKPKLIERIRKIVTK